MDITLRSVVQPVLRQPDSRCDSACGLPKLGRRAGIERECIYVLGTLPGFVQENHRRPADDPKVYLNVSSAKLSSQCIERAKDVCLREADHLGPYYQCGLASPRTRRLRR